MLINDSIFKSFSGYYLIQNSVHINNIIVLSLTKYMKILCDQNKLSKIFTRAYMCV